MRTNVRAGYSLPRGSSTALVGAVIAVAGGLRAAGVPVSTGETIDATRALSVIDLARRDTVCAALRAALLKDDVHDDVFDRVFDLVFPAPRREEEAAAGAAPRPPGEPREDLLDALRRGDDGGVTAALDEAVDRWSGIPDDAAEPRTERHHIQRVLRRLGLDRLLQELLRDDEDRTTLQRRLAGAQAHEQVAEVLRLLEQLVRDRLGDDRRPPAAELADLPILHAAPDELTALRAAVRPLARRIATRLGRRRRPGRGHLDMRRTIRGSMSSGGVPLHPELRRRHPTKPDLVVLCDVSGSVARFAPFTLSLLHALHGEFRRVRSWVFVDGIVEVTSFLESAPGVIDARRLLAPRGLVAHDGRSDYGHAFAQFRRRWPDAVTGKTTLLVIGDARSHDRPPALHEVAGLHRQARRLYWFNPEPRREWDTADSAMSAYSLHSTGTFEVGTLRRLAEAVTAIAA